MESIEKAKLLLDKDGMRKYCFEKLYRHYNVDEPSGDRIPVELIMDDLFTTADTIKDEAEIASYWEEEYESANFYEDGYTKDDILYENDIDFVQQNEHEIVYQTAKRLIEKVFENDEDFLLIVEDILLQYAKF